MYTGKHARLRPLQPAFIMAASGEAVTYRELEARCNRLAHLFRNRGLKRLDHYAIFMENNSRYLEACGAGERSGLYFTCVNSYLTAAELAYILTNSQSRILVTSRAKLDVAREALKECPKVELCIVADGEGESDRIVGLQQATSGLPHTPIADESIGTAMLYSSGTTGRPKGILRPLPDMPPGTATADVRFPAKALALPRRHDLPVARAALSFGAAGRRQPDDPQAAAPSSSWNGFDPERYLALDREMGRHAQPAGADDVLAHAETAGGGAQALRPFIARDRDPCRRTLPCSVKDDMIEWWGPIIHEYYGATEGLGFTACDSEEWLAHRGTVGRVLLGDLHILDEDMQPCPAARRARCGSRPPRRSNISTIRPRRRRPVRPTAA